MRSLVFVFLIISFQMLSAIIINIPADQPTIQAGINVAVNTDTILVQPGTYVENINYNGKLITVASLFLTTQDTTYISTTIIDGNENGSVVIFESGEDSTVVLCGFTITNGETEHGGGIRCVNSFPCLKNLLIIDNSALWGEPYYTGSGGGIYCLFSNPILQNVTIAGNIAYEDGGGIYCFSSNPNLINVLISDNHGVITAGGIYCDNSSPNLENVTISGNTTSNFGGGIYCHSNSSPSLENITITGNSSGVYGGGILFASGNYQSLVNITITDNSAIAGGGIYVVGSSLSLVNVTIAGNTAYNWGGGIYCNNYSSPSLVNCVMWNDSPQEVYFDGITGSNSFTVSYSDIQGGEAGIVTNNSGTVNWLEGNIDEDPLFVGTGEYSYSLLEDSPCIDTGIPDTTGLNLPPWDIIGNLRIWDGDGDGIAIIDMGTYEYGAPLYVNVDDNIIVQTPGALLQQNYPNPFNPTTTISFSIPEESKVELSVFNIKGQKIITLAHNVFDKGDYLIIWNGADESNKPVSSGVYLYKLNVNGITESVKKCILLK